MTRRAWEIVVYVMMLPLLILVVSGLLAAIWQAPWVALALVYLAVLLYAMAKSW